MKPLSRFLLILVIGLVCAPATNSETLVLSSGRTIDGAIIRTNGNDLMVVTDYGTFNFGRDNIKQIKGAQAEGPAIHATGRLPDFKTTILALSARAWATDLAQIPATVIDKGLFRNVPYVSFRCGEDYELNVYGDLKDPAAIEAGIYRKLLEDASAKDNCINLLEASPSDVQTAEHS